MITEPTPEQYSKFWNHTHGTIGVDVCGDISVDLTCICGWRELIEVDADDLDTADIARMAHAKQCGQAPPEVVE